jgi:hypothetical protein
MRVYKYVGAISNIYFNISMIDVFVLMYKHYLNRIIVYG